MKAMVLEQITSLERNKSPLALKELPDPTLDDGQVRLKVKVCGVCHTELDEIEGRTRPPHLPVVPGHQVVGVVDQIGPRVTSLKAGDRVGVAWIYWADGTCYYCQSGTENLCPEFKATGRDVNGGYAEYMTVPEGFAYPIPEALTDEGAAPLLCAGAVGYRALRLSCLEDGRNLGLTGFGASGHLVIQFARYKYPNSQIYVFARSPDERAFAEELGAVWTGDTDEEAPEKLDAIIDTTPVWKPVVEALKNLAPGGRLVINAIRKEDLDKEYLQNLKYSSHLWMEREIKSVANVTRQDVSELLQLAADMGLTPEYQMFDLEEANEALLEVKLGKIRGAKVLRIG